MKSDAATVADYLEELPPQSAAIVAEVRDLVNDHLPPGYDEVMRWGMITWEVPLDRYPSTYNGKPLQFAALAAQKRHLSLYLNSVAFSPGGEEAFRKEWDKTGKPLDMGRSCVRFRSTDELAGTVLARHIAAASVDVYLARYEEGRGIT